MRIIRDISSLDVPRSAATIGFFDGLHKGHRFLLEQVAKMARERSLASLAITFVRHPLEVINPGCGQKYLSTLDEKLQMMESTGIDTVAVLDFDIAMSMMSARSFMEEILRDRLNVSCLVIGYDHRFGHDRREGFDDYARFGKELGIDVVQAPSYSQDGIQPSSSFIRACIVKGDVEQAAMALGYHYSLGGVVVSGRQIGRSMGFPTANIRLDDGSKLIPENGVYAVWVSVSGNRYQGMLNIGSRPTFHDGGELTLEVHILDFSGDIYGNHIVLEFARRLRYEIEFSSVEKLITQLETDRDEIRKIFKTIQI